MSSSASNAPTFTPINQASERMLIDGDPSPHRLVPRYDYNLVTTSHERVYPTNGEGATTPVIPYLELPDYRPTQSNLPPLTIRFKRHHVELPTDFDDSGAKVGLVNFIAFTILGQIRDLLGPEHYKQRYTFHTVAYGVNHRSPSRTQNVYCSKLTTSHFCKNYSTRRSSYTSLIRHSLLKTQISLVTPILSPLRSQDFQAMIWTAQVMQRSKTWQTRWPTKSKSLQTPVPTQWMELSQSPKLPMYTLNSLNSNLKKTSALTAYSVPPSGSSLPRLSSLSSAASSDSMTLPTCCNTEVASNTAPAAAIGPAGNPIPPICVPSPRESDANGVVAPGTSKRTAPVLLTHLQQAQSSTKHPLRGILSSNRPQLPFRHCPPFELHSGPCSLIPPLLGVLSTRLAPLTKEAQNRPPISTRWKLKGALTRLVPSRYRYLVFAACPLTIVSINHPGNNSVLLEDVARFRPDVLMVQEAHSTVNRMMVGSTRAPIYSPQGYKIAALSHYNSIYIFNKNLTVNSHHIAERYVRLTISTSVPYRNAKAGNQLIVQSCYVPSSTNERKNFFAEDGLDIQDLPTSSSLPPSILMGDFNDYPDPALDFHKNGTEAITMADQKNRKWRSHLASTLDDANLIDAFRLLHPTSQKFSRVHQIKNKIISQARIDHALVSSRLSKSVLSCHYEVCPSSDHYYMILRLKPDDDLEIGPGRWHLHTGVTLDPQFVTEIRTFLSEAIPSLNSRFSMTEWIELKRRLIFSAKKVAAPIGPRNKMHKQEAIMLIEQLNSTDWSDAEQIEMYGRCITRLRYLQNLQHLHHSLRLSAKSPFLHDPWLPIENPTPLITKRDFIVELLDEKGNTCQAKSDLLSAVERFYTNLYAQAGNYDEEAAGRLLGNITSKLSARCKDSLKRPLNVNELKSALSSCQSYSAAGEDGLPFEFWKIIDDQITPLFHKALLVSWTQNPHENSSLPLMGTLIFKKGDRKLLTNYRPISVMNSDLRWLAKAETTRLTPAVASVISTNQTAFLPDRQISDSVLAIMLLCEFANQGLLKDLTILSLDQEKAYDRVNRRYLYETLRAFNFPEEVITRLSYYHNRPVIQYKVNNHLTSAINIEKGVGQGDPQSCLLYIISLQPLLDTLSKPEIRTDLTLPLTKSIVSFVALAFADNIVFPVASGQALNNALEALADYEATSGGKINRGKTVAIFPNPEGKTNDHTHWHSQIPYATHTSREEKVELGCPFRPDGQIPAMFLYRLLNTIRGIASDWYKSKLCEKDRVILANSLVIGKIAHATQLCPLTPDFHMGVGQILTKMIFRSSKMAAPFKHICLPPNQGGLGLINPKHQATAMSGKIIARQFQSQDTLGKTFRSAVAEILLQNGLGVTELYNGKLCIVR
jgi:exonuclease III